MNAGPVLCLECTHVHGGRAFGICLEAGCSCIVPRRWPAAFPSEAERRAWCASDRAAEVAENVLIAQVWQLGGLAQ